MKKCLHRVGTGLNYFQRAAAIDRLKVSASQGLEDQTVIISQLVHTTLLPRAEVNTYWNLGKADFADVKSFPAHISSPSYHVTNSFGGKPKEFYLTHVSASITSGKDGWMELPSAVKKFRRILVATFAREACVKSSVGRTFRTTECVLRRIQLDHKNYRTRLARFFTAGASAYV